MGKNKGGKSSGYISSGQCKNVSRKTLNAMKRDRSPAEKLANIQKAWLKGQNPWITIQNPNKEQTNKKFIRVRMNDLNGNPKDRSKKIFTMQ